MKAESRVYMGAFENSLQQARNSVAQARKATGADGFTFVLKNTARDVKARNPDHDIFYFDAVDKGRKRIEAMNNLTNASPTLRFKFGPLSSNWVITKAVRKSKPVRIRQKARQALRESLVQKTAEAFNTGGKLPTGETFIRAFKVMQIEVVEQYKQATLKSTKQHNTKFNFYGVVASPLSESFVTEVNNG